MTIIKTFESSQNYSLFVSKGFVLIETPLEMLQKIIENKKPLLVFPMYVLIMPWIIKHYVSRKKDKWIRNF